MVQLLCFKVVWTLLELILNMKFINFYMLQIQKVSSTWYELWLIDVILCLILHQVNDVEYWLTTSDPAPATPAQVLLYIHLRIPYLKKQHDSTWLKISNLNCKLRREMKSHKNET